jgi:L-ascorbate metabolism protein UlaG (beta-lactamase superfamily)
MLTQHGVNRLRGIFISHTHHDHVMDAPFIANKTGAVIYGSASAMNVARGGDVPEGQMIQFEPNQTYRLGGYSVRVIPSIHSRPNLLNNDLGQTIDAPLRQPARLRSYKEGGSYDFYVEAEGKRIMIRPSFNYVEGQMDGYRADVLFLGVAGLQKADTAMEAAFYRETIEKVDPKLVIPVHWDNFFSPLTKPVVGMPKLIEKTEVVFFRLARYCAANGRNCLVQIPGTSIEL